MQNREKIQLELKEKLIEDSSTIANKFNNLFSEITSKMRDKFKASILPEPKRTKSQMNFFQLTEITPNEIVRIITNLNEKNQRKLMIFK